MAITTSKECSFKIIIGRNTIVFRKHKWSSALVLCVLEVGQNVKF